MAITLTTQQRQALSQLKLREIPGSTSCWVAVKPDSAVPPSTWNLAADGTATRLD